MLTDERVQPIISQRAERKTRKTVSYICGDMGPSPDRIVDLKPSQIDCAGRGAPPAIRSEDLDESERLRPALGTVQQLLAKQCGNCNQTLDGVVDKELMKSNSIESKTETK